MGPYEVRIHYAANNTVSEDARWMQIARGAVNFKSVRKLRLSDSIIDPSGRQALTSENSSQSHNPAQPIIISSQSDVFPQSQSSVTTTAESNSEVTPQKTTKRKAHILLEQPSPELAKRTKRTSFARTKKGLNPAFKNPVAGYMKTRKSSHLSQKTPRPQFLPEATVVVPVTESPRRPHTLSNLGRTQKLMEKTSSPDQSVTSHIDETSFVENSTILSGSVEARSLESSHHSVSDYSFEMGKYPGNQEQLYTSNHYTQQCTTYDREKLIFSVQEDFGETELDMGTLDTSPAHENRPGTPTATTVTPSDSGEYIDNSSPLAQKSTATKFAPLVDLTSPPQDEPLEMTRRDVLGPVSSPLPEREEVSRSSEITNIGYEEILNLPRRVMCHTMHTVKSRTFNSFLPQYLLDLAEGFGLVNHFRPVLAPASVRNSERGYWNMRIQISDIATVGRSRRSPLTSSQWSDKRFMMRQEGLLPDTVATAEGNNALRQILHPDLDPDTYTPWTVDELKTFWKYLAKVVERGRAGYDVRATLKCSEAASNNLRVNVRLYGYAETLSHLWLVLYGVSSTLSAMMPLQWCMPGTGPLITMSGQPKRGGALGRWLPKEYGADGSWGLEDDWDGLSSARDLGRNEY